MPMRSLFLTPRLFAAIAALVAVFVVAFFWAPLLAAGQAGVAVLALALLVDVLALCVVGGRLEGARTVPAKLSLGDDNASRSRSGAATPSPAASS